MQSVLESLAEMPGGMARLSNIASGLKQNHISPSALRKLLSETAEVSVGSYAGTERKYRGYQRLRDCIIRRQQELYFQRSTPQLCESGCALVLPLGVFKGDASFQLFKREYVDQGRDYGLLPRAIESAYDLDMLLSYLRQGFRDGLPEIGGLGDPKSGIVTFLTPLDETWEKLTVKRIEGISPLEAMPSGCDVASILDYLGLPYTDSSGWLIELRTKLPLREIVGLAGRHGKCAAPTVLESLGHDYFRHWPNYDGTDRYGRTLHFDTLRAGGPDSAGRPEVIVDHIPGSVLASHFEVSILGRIPVRHIPKPDEVATYLVGNRERDDLIKEICEKL